MRSHLEFNAKLASMHLSSTESQQQSLDAERDILRSATGQIKVQLYYLNIMKASISCGLQIFIFVYIMIKFILT